MRQKKLIWQIFPVNLIILLVAMVSLTWYGAVSLRAFYLTELESDLIARAHLVKESILIHLQGESLETLREFTISSGRESETRITVIDLQGIVLADSNEDPETMESHKTRPEIQAAMKGRVGKTLRFSKTLGLEMLYVAIPLYSGAKFEDQLIGVLRASVPATAIDRALQRIRTRIGYGVLVLVLLAGGVTLLVSRNLSKPLEQMKRSAERYSKGDFSRRMSSQLGSSASLEVATLAASMDKMAQELDERIYTIIGKKNELEAVFSSMVEVVIAVDSSERVLNINKSGAELFGVDRESAKGKIVQEVIRDFNLEKQISQVLKTGSALEGEVTLLDQEGERFLQTHLVSFTNDNSQDPGVLVVLNDVTRIRRLENIRRDFVANVSHELRTPITSIRGYVETLLDGALDDPSASREFLKVVLRQADRLNDIIEDLLALSRIEKETEKGGIDRELGDLREVLEAAVLSCEVRASQADVGILLECPKNMLLSINPTLLEQAVVNLLVNGIKYSDAGGRIKVSGQKREEGGEEKVYISVEDTGVGIAKEHLSRLFERFYRIDQARSRKSGGTGLGLAIVKHIVQAHGGEVLVESYVGEGSTFTIVLPV